MAEEIDLNQKISILEEENTTLKKRENETVKQKALLEKIITLMPVSVYINNRAPFKPEWISGGLFEDTGYTKEEWENFTPEEFATLFEWSSYEYYLQCFQKIMGATDNEIIESEYRMRCKDGSWIDCFSRAMVFSRDENQLPAQVLCTALNISSLKSTQRQLKENKSRYKTFFENSPENLVILDLDFNIIDINQAMLTFSGYTRGEIAGVHVLNFISPEKHQQYQKLEPVIQENGYKYHYQSEFINKSKQTFYIDLTHWPVINENNETTAMMVVIKDITAQKLREDQLVAENQTLKQELSFIDVKQPEVFKNIITQERCMLNVFKYLEAISQNSESLFISGETGTGKELIAESFYRLCKLKGKFITVNAAGLDDQMFADTLFGHKKGAFTGAERELKGLIETAHDGVLFLDEIGDLSINSQVKLLRLLQNREYYNLGSDEIRTTNARIVAATNRNLQELVRDNKFRADLLYRLTVHTVNLPPLRERMGDLPLLVEYYVKEICKIHDRKALKVPTEIINLLSTYDFPGNIRELRNMLFDAVNTCTTETIRTDYFYHYIRLNSKDRQQIKAEDERLIFPQVLPSLEQTREFLIREALTRANGNITQAAKLLKMERSALSKAVKQLTL